MQKKLQTVLIRKPLKSDGLTIHQLISQSPPLDLNSIYSYFLLCDHFRESCVVAEINDQIVGFVSAYRLPDRPDTLFVWQVVVSHKQRGKKIAWLMLNDLIQRFDGTELKYLEATVNPDNLASRGLFERLAAKNKTTLKESIYLDSSTFGAGQKHQSEILLKISLFNSNY